MAAYSYSGPDAGLFDAEPGGSLKPRLLYQRADEFGLLNPDGSKTYFHGSGLVWNRSTGHFTAGTITRIDHYSPTGGFIDRLADLNIAAAELDAALQGASATSAFRDTILGGADVITGGIGDDYLTAGSGNDRIDGLDGNDILSGQGGSDGLYGGNGDDVLIGGTGADLLDGGAGNDWATYTASPEGIYVNLLVGKGQGGDVAGDTLISIEHVSGSAMADTLTGNDAANALYGRDGNDVLNGGKGNDVLRGGSGADQLNGGSGLDWANYRDSDAGVFVNLLNGSASGGDAQGDKLSFIENLAGSDFYDLLTGNNAGNVLFGNGGDDTLHGKDGDDRADGGTGNDFLTGGDGADILMGGDGNDLIDAGTGCDLIKGGAGDDVIYGGTDPDVVIYDFAWEEITADYHSTDFSIWVGTPDGNDHIFSALTLATTTGTYRYDVPTATWVHESDLTGSDWLLL